MGSAGLVRPVLATIAVAVVVVVATPEAPASEAIAEREEGLDCATCHVRPPKAKLNDRGLYYESIGTLDGFDQLIASFGSCSHCHVRKPGSRKLTRAGKRFERFVGDMDALREWLEAMHPPFGREIGSRGGGSAVAAAAAD